MEGEETTEVADTEVEETTQQLEVVQEGPSWHRNTRPAEPEGAPSLTNEVKLEIEQLAYLICWMGKDKSHIMAWEREKSDDQANEEEEVARKLAKIDNETGEESHTWQPKTNCRN